MGGSDKQKLAEGTFEYDTSEAAIVALASGKMTADAFAAMDINNRDEFVRTLEQTPTAEIDTLIQQTAQKLVDDAAYAGHTLTQEEALETARQNFAQAIIPIDKAQFDVRLNRNLAPRDRERYNNMRTKLREISGNRDPKVETGKLKADGTPETKPYTGFVAER
jgi:hypothetical protein